MAATDFAEFDRLPGRRRPLWELLALAGPTVAQMASYTFMQFADRTMLAAVGDMEATAAGTAGLTYFCFLGFGFGVLLVVNTLVSQSFGQRDYISTGRYMWQGVWFALGFGLLSAAAYPLAGPLFRAMNHAPLIAALEADYFRVAALGAVPKLISVALAQYLLGLQRPVVVLVGSLAGAAVNVLFNWLLIYGNWGFPALGVAGAAWGTNGAVVVEMLVCAAYVLRPSVVRGFNALDWPLRWDLCRTLLKVGAPAGLQLVCDITAWAVFMNIIVGSFGTTSLAANSFVFTYMHLCFMPAVGVGQAVTALVGKYIGMNRHDVAEQRAHLGFAVCALYMVIAGLMLALFRHSLIGLFSKDPQVQQIGATLMLFVAGYQIFDAMFLVYTSALRGAGDTLLPAIVQAALIWTIVVGGGAAAARYAPQWGAAGPWTLATLFAAILGAFLQIRFRRGRWRQIRLHQRAADAGEAADVSPGAASSDTVGELRSVTSNT